MKKFRMMHIFSFPTIEVARIMIVLSSARFLEEIIMIKGVDSNGK